MDIRTEALRLASIATAFVWLGWLLVIYAIVAAIFWFIDLANTTAVDWIHALGLSLSAIGGPLFLALIVAGLGHFLRLFALDAASRAA